MHLVQAQLHPCVIQYLLCTALPVSHLCFLTRDPVALRIWGDRPGGCQGAQHRACGGPGLEFPIFSHPAVTLGTSGFPSRHCSIPVSASPCWMSCFPVIWRFEFQSSQTLCLRWLKCQTFVLKMHAFPHIYFHSSGPIPFHYGRSPHCGRLSVPRV